MRKDGLCNLEIVVCKGTDEFTRRMIEHRDTAGQFLADISLDLMQQASEDLVDQQGDTRWKVATTIQDQPSHAVEQRMTTRAGTIASQLCQLLKRSMHGGHPFMYEP